MAIVVGTTAPVLAAEESTPVEPAPAEPNAASAPTSEEAAPTGGEAAVVTAEPEAASTDPEAASTDEPEGGQELPSLEVAGVDDRPAGHRSRRQDKPEGQDVDRSKRPRASASVTIEDFEFNPGTLTISPGDRVTWTNRDTAKHNAVDQGNAFETRLLGKGESESVTIDEAGTYDYICTVHPQMKAKLVAQGGGGGGASGDSGSGSSPDSGGSSGGTSSSEGSGSSTASPGASSGGTGSSESGGSSGSSGTLPNTGQEQIPLLILGAGLIVAGLLTRAFHEYWIWR
jgi:LPXTG-motif cell wall-anchored protein